MVYGLDRGTCRACAVVEGVSAAVDNHGLIEGRPIAMDNAALSIESLVSHYGVISFKQVQETTLYVLSALCQRCYLYKACMDTKITAPHSDMPVRPL